MPRHARSLLAIVPSAALLLAPASVGAASLTPPRPETLKVEPARARVTPGQPIDFVIAAPGHELPQAVLLEPARGERSIGLERAGAGRFRVQLTLSEESPRGLYLLHAWVGDRRRPSAIGKGALLLGPVVMDFMLPAYVDRTDPAGDLGSYLDEFASLGGNTLIAHALITPERAYFPSAIARTPLRRGDPADLVERVLGEADRRGLAVFLSVSWDMTRKTPYRDRMPEIAALMRELFDLYAHHPSLAGFYSYQEGSGTYYVPYVREFTEQAKRLNAGLLTAVAPFLDDPLLAGYLSTVDTLDVIIYQAMVMASYRPDNRKLFPARRAHDFAALGVGSKWLQDKFAIVHVEVFAYAEKRIAPDVLAAPYEDIYTQIAGVGAAAASDGIALFAYHPHLYAPRADPRVASSRRAVADGLAVFSRLRAGVSAAPRALAAYVPYSDWIVERWTANIVPGLDGFRLAGVPVDILPYAPPADESHYPYFPFHMNPDVLARLLDRKQVLVLTDVSGFQQTDSDLMEAFLKAGGTVVAFGPQIPFGRTFDRKEVFGGFEAGRRAHKAIRVKTAFGGRVKAGDIKALGRPGTLPVWTATTARVLATFDDGSPAVLANAYGKGLAIAVLPSAAQAARAFAALTRDVLDMALARHGHAPLIDIDGLSEETDVATAADAGGADAAVVNYGAAPLDLRLSAGRPGAWIDVSTGAALAVDERMRASVRVASHGVGMFRFVPAVKDAGR